MSDRRIWSLVLLAAGLASPARATPVVYSDVVVFGDSLSDVGNTANNVFSQLADFFGDDTFDAVIDGRFSNGPVWVERLSTKLGLPGSASARSDTGGDNHAHGGATTGPGGLTILFSDVIDNLGRQIDKYTSSNTPAGDELFIVWGGGNDFFDGVGTPASVAANMNSHITALANDGAQHLLVMNLPKLGDVPRHRGTANQAILNGQASAYNDLLDSKVAALEVSLGLDITLFDVEALFDRLINEPSIFGFTNTADPAFGTGAADPGRYVFWDEIHPTAAAHAVLADAVFVALQIPGDFTGDGVVDDNDLSLVINRYGQPVTPFNLDQGDWDGDGEVGVFEIDLVLTNWTQPLSQVVPEPASIAWVVLLCLVRRSRRLPQPMASGGSSHRRTRRRCGR